METNRRGYCTRSDVVGSAECGKEIVERLFVHQVDNRQSGAPLVAIAVKNVVVSHGQVKQVARLGSLRIVIVVFGAGFRDLEVN